MLKPYDLTLDQTLAAHREMWAWLAQNPDKKKHHWPGWQRFRMRYGNVMVLVDCFLCAYALAEVIRLNPSQSKTCFYLVESGGCDNYTSCDDCPGVDTGNVEIIDRCQYCPLDIGECCSNPCSSCADFKTCDSPVDCEKYPLFDLWCECGSPTVKVKTALKIALAPLSEYYKAKEAA